MLINICVIPCYCLPQLFTHGHCLCFLGTRTQPHLQTFSCIFQSTFHLSDLSLLLLSRFRYMKQCWAMEPEQRPTFRALYDLLSTFQKSLARRKTLLTTLTSTLQSIASVRDVDSPVDRRRKSRSRALPKVVVTKTESMFDNVFESADDQSSAGISQWSSTAGLDSAFENEAESETLSHSSHLALHTTYSRPLKSAQTASTEKRPESSLPNGSQNGVAMLATDEMVRDSPGKSNDSQASNQTNTDSGHASCTIGQAVTLHDFSISESSV